MNLNDVVSDDIIAPVVIFVYKRLDTVKLLVESINESEYANSTSLYIFSDGPKNRDDIGKVTKVRKYINKIKGFRDVSVYKSKINKGLAASIISGVDEVFKQHDRVIVLEDDLVVSGNFLCYMNSALKFYENINRIFSISGYTMPLKSLNSYEFDTYTSFRPSSWGWSTWKDRWEGIDWEVTDFEEFIKNKKAVKKFNRGGIDMSRMLKDYMEGKNNSWAIRWSYAMYKRNGLSVYPRVSKVSNAGFGKDATHCTGINIYKTNIDDSSRCDFKFREDVEPVDSIVKEFKYQYSYGNKLIKKIAGALWN